MIVKCKSIKEMNPMTDKTRILIRVPNEIKKELQIIAIKNDTNMTEIILNLIEEYIKMLYFILLP